MNRGHLLQYIQEHETTILHKTVVGPFTGKVVKAHDLDVEYAWAMWRVYAKELKEKYEEERPYPKLE